MCILIHKIITLPNNMHGLSFAAAVYLQNKWINDVFSK